MLNPTHSKNWCRDGTRIPSPPLLPFADLTALVGIPFKWLKLVPCLHFFPTLVMVDVSELEDEMNVVDNKDTLSVSLLHGLPCSWSETHLL